MTRSRKPSAQVAVVLGALRDGPSAGRNGEDLIRETGLAAGSLYSVLMRLADRGVLAASWAPRPQPGRPARHCYRLTGGPGDLAMTGPGTDDLAMTGQPTGGQEEGEPPGGDLARRALAAAVTWIPADREEWGRAMLAELDQVSGHRARWRFASGAARTALIPPGSRSLRAAIVLAVTAIVAAISIYALSPGTGAVTAVAAPIAAALGAWAALARPRQAQDARKGREGRDGRDGREDREVNVAGRAAQVIAVAVIAACPVVALGVLVRYPVHANGLTRYAWPAGAVVFAAELAACLWPVLRRPGPLGATRGGGLLGVTAALVTAYILHLNQQPIGPSGTAVVETALAAPVVAGVLAAVFGAVQRDPVKQLLRAGIGEWLWGVLATGPAVFVVLTTDTTAANAVIIDARHHMLTYIMMTHPQVASSVLDPIAQGKLGDAAVVLTGVLVLVMLIFLLVFPPARARRYLNDLRTRPGWGSAPAPVPADADWPERRPWWPGPVQPGHDAGPDIISQGNPPF
jgi:PadR family transcriptional regulator PadR